MSTQNKYNQNTNQEVDVTFFLSQHKKADHN